jgi:O-antigen/teichoic acid export membrane protein
LRVHFWLFCWVLFLGRRFAGGSGASICPHFDARVLGRLTRLALPMGGVGALLSLNASVPRYFVQHYLGEASLGLFSAVAYPMVASDTLVNSLVQLTSPRLAKYYGTNDIRSFRRLLLRLMTVGSITGCLAVGTVLLAGHAMLLLLYRPEYASQTMVFVYVVIAVALGYSYMFIGVAVTAMRLFRIQFYLKVGVCLCLTILSAILIPRFGLTGAAAALICAALVEGAAWSVIAYAYIWGQPADSAEIVPRVSAGAYQS